MNKTVKKWMNRLFKPTREEFERQALELAKVKQERDTALTNLKEFVETFDKRVLEEHRRVDEFIRPFVNIKDTGLYEIEHRLGLQIQISNSLLIQISLLPLSSAERRRAGEMVAFFITRELERIHVIPPYDSRYRGF